MSVIQRKIELLDERISFLHSKEQSVSSSHKARLYKTYRWILMLYREFLRDEITVRAESLAFLMIFSIMPLIAGCFFIITIFTQFGMVQESIAAFVSRLTQDIPPAHREMITEYTLKFKDAYLASISGKSGKLGIFALLFLVWVGLQTFNNMDKTINYIWGSENERPFLEKFRNFIVIAIGAPFVLIASLSLPLIIRKLPSTKILVDTLPFVFNLIDLALPLVLILATFTSVYRYFPVKKVPLKHALIGGIFSAILLQLSNIGMNLYFRYGTNTAYGKAAVVPIIAFWIYLVWMIVILGAELSYLVNQEKIILHSNRKSMGFYECESLLAVLKTLDGAFINGQSPLTSEELMNQCAIGPLALKNTLSFLEKENLILHCTGKRENLSAGFALARDISKIKISDILERFAIQNRPSPQHPAINKTFRQSLETWLSSFESQTFADLR